MVGSLTGGGLLPKSNGGARRCAQHGRKSCNECNGSNYPSNTTATLELRHGPDSYGRQQWGILDNGGNPDPAIPRVFEG